MTRAKTKQKAREGLVARMAALKMAPGPRILQFPAGILGDIFHHNASTVEWTLDDVKNPVDLNDSFHVARRDFRNYSELWRCHDLWIV